MQKKIETLESAAPVLPGLLRELRGEVFQEDFYPRFGIRIVTGRNWEQGRNVPKLSLLFGLVRILGRRGLEKLGFDPAVLIDVLCPDPSAPVELRRSREIAIRSIDILFESAARGSRFGEDQLKRFSEQLQTRAGNAVQAESAKGEKPKGGKP